VLARSVGRPYSNGGNKSQISEPSNEINFASVVDLFQLNITYFFSAWSIHDCQQFISKAEFVVAANKTPQPLCILRVAQ